MKLTNDAKTYIHYLFTLNYKLALHVLAAVCEDDKQIDVNALMQIGQRMLARTEADAEYADFIAVNGDEQLRWARKHASHKHNVELTIARAIRIVLEKEKLGQAPILIAGGAHRFIEGPVVNEQVAELIGDAALRNCSLQMIINRTKHIGIEIANGPEMVGLVPADSPVKKVY